MPLLSGFHASFQALTPVTRGALYMVAAGVFFAGMNVCVRLATDSGLPPIETVFFRNFFALLWLLPWLLRTRFVGVHTQRLGQHFWRAFVGLAGMTLWFFSVSALPLAQAVALNFTFPLFTTILAALVLKEEVRARRWTATLIGFLGVLVILQPWQGTVVPELLLPIGAALCMAASSVLVKRLSMTESAGTVVFYMNAFTTPMALLPALAVWVWPAPEVWIYLVLLGCCAVISHICLTRAFMQCDASAIQPFDYLRLPLMAGLAYLLFGEVPGPWLWAGAAVIVASSLYIARREAVLARQKPPGGPIA